jgi:hypothetical protein
MEREIIYGVCDKTGICDSYFGFFKSQEDAQKEVQTQADRLKEDLGMMNVKVLNDRAIVPDENKDKLVIVIHSFVLR